MRGNEAVFNAQRLACQVKDVGAGGGLALAGEAVRELTAIVGQELDDLPGSGLMQE
jgi:hypothetical protein